MNILAELAAQYQVHPNRVSQWKKQLLSQARDVFSGKNSDSGKIAFLALFTHVVQMCVQQIAQRSGCFAL